MRQMVSKLVRCCTSDRHRAAAPKYPRLSGFRRATAVGIELVIWIGTMERATDAPGTTRSMPEGRDGGGGPFRLQSRPVRSSFSIVPLLFIAFALSAGACSREIGDDCSTAADCDPKGSRVCDLSQPGGYCTVVNCDENSCPSESACIRFFPIPYLSKG